jgi:Tfp pilus assembly protein PilZ
MQAKPEVRKSERLGHEYIVKIGDDQALSPYYAVSYNLSETGIHFKSLFEMHPGAHILIRIDDYTLSQNKVPAKVVWCKNIENAATFRYGVGVEFLQSEKNFGSSVSFSITPRMKALNKKEGGVVIRKDYL